MCLAYPLATCVRFENKIFLKICHAQQPPLMSTNFSKVDYSTTQIKEYRVSACKTPSVKEPQPQVFSATVFAKNSVFAQARMLKMLNKQYKMKPSNTVIIETREIEEDTDFTFKNYGIKFVYRTKSGLCNGYKEIRHINRVLAVSDLYQEFGSKHKLSSSKIFVYEIRQLADEEVTKTKILSYMGEDTAFPVFDKVPNTEAEVVSVNYNIFD